MTAPLRLAFIGCGRIVERQVAEGWADLPEIALAGWWSHRLETAEKRRAQAGRGDVFADWRSMLDQVRPEAVLVAVPPFAHGDIEAELISRRIPFLVEKPVGLAVAAARRIEAAITAARLVVAVGYNARFTAGVIRAKEALAGHLPIFVRASVINNLARTPDFAEHWWIKRALSGGQLVEQSTHHIDLIRHLLGTEVRAVQAMSVRIAPGTLPAADVEDVLATQLSLASGALASFTDATVIAPARGHTFEVFSSDLKIELARLGPRRAPDALPEGEVRKPWRRKSAISPGSCSLSSPRCGPGACSPPSLPTRMGSRRSKWPKPPRSRWRGAKRSIWTLPHEPTRPPAGGCRRF